MRLFIPITLLTLFSIIPFVRPHADESAQPISFALVGDIMLGTDYPDSMIKKFPCDEGRGLLKYVKSVLSEADVAIGNLEGAITCADSCTKVTEDSIAYAFRMPPFLAPRLLEAGFDVLNTANNHTNDFGNRGRMETESILDSLGIAHTGRNGDIVALDVRGTSIAVVGFSTSPGDNSLLDIEKTSALIDSLNSQFDIVVATFHGGAEGKEYTRLPDGPECFLGENRGDLRLFAHCAVDAGADVVFGHGPHVPRGLEVYRKRIIAYSLGNFCTWFGLNVNGVNGLAPLLRVEIDPDGCLRYMKIFSFEQQSRHYPVPDPEKKAEKLIVELSEIDFGSFPHEFMERKK